MTSAAEDRADRIVCRCGWVLKDRFGPSGVFENPDRPEDLPSPVLRSLLRIRASAAALESQCADALYPAGCEWPTGDVHSALIRAAESSRRIADSLGKLALPLGTLNAKKETE